MTHFGDDRDWFFEKRFGLFMHFGLYAIEGWHEQDQMRRFIPRAEYVKRLPRFNPTEFDADRILDLAEEVGMGYVCLTTKHHDGFCLWDTAHTDFNVMNSPYGKDLIRQLADACHRRDFPLGLYYSVADWHHPNYPNEGRHHELPGPEPGDSPDWQKYLAFLKEQVRELCTNYGPVRHFFWDMNVPEYQDPSINEMIRALQPAAVINDRGFDEGDFGTPEREYQSAETAEAMQFAKPTEACNSVGTQSWGYRCDEDYYSTRFLIESMDKIFAKGGNYLLNVGPDADGTIPERAESILRSIGRWYARAKGAFEGAENVSNLTDNGDVMLTRRENEVFVHLSCPPRSDAVVLKPISEKPAEAVLLNTGKPVQTAVDLLPIHWASKQPYLRIKGLPIDDLANEVPVVKLTFERPLTPSAAAGAKESVG